MALSGILTVLLAFGTTILCIVLLRPIAARLRLVDHPDQRKDHVGAVPLIGGVAIWFAFLICLLFIGMSMELAALILAGSLLAVVGAVDDAKDLSPHWRLALHISAVLIMIFLGGIAVTSLGEAIIPGKEIFLGWLSVPFTVFAVVAMINAANMSDGLDGLCGLQIFIALAGLAFLTGIAGDREHFLPLLALCGCVVGFLFFNLRTKWRSRASIFLGDAGSNFLGFVLAWFLIDLSQGSDAILQPVAVLWFALLLIYDTIEVVARRLLRGQSPFAADREHLHHVFRMAKFSVSETVLILGAITLISVLFGMATTVINIPESALFAAFIVFGLLFLHWILHSWSVMRFLYRSICRRRGERRQETLDFWTGEERRSGHDRRDRREQTRKAS